MVVSTHIAQMGPSHAMQRYSVWYAYAWLHAGQIPPSSSSHQGRFRCDFAIRIWFRAFWVPQMRILSRASFSDLEPAMRVCSLL